MVCWHWHLSPSVMFWDSFFLIAKYYSIVRLYHILVSIHQLVIFGLLPPFVCYEYCSHERLYMIFVQMHNSFFLGYMCPGVELLGHMVTSCFSTFWETTKLFSKAAAPLHIVTSTTWGCNFFASSPIAVICFWILVMVVGVKWDLQMDLVLHFQ